MTREETKKKIRQMSLPKETMEILEALAPELAESEDERIRKALIDALKTSKSVGELKFILPEPTREGCIAYLEKQKEQKQVPISCGHEKGTPAEWSEEDKSFYDSIMCEVIKEGMHPTPEQANWFKFLPERFNIQPKQEWSNEDEEMLNSIINVVCGIVQPSNGLREKQVRFLKSHLPSWKPSEEQIYSLGTVIKGMGDVTVGSVGYNLKELYEQLKELM